MVILRENIMPTPLFFGLCTEKRQNIFAAGISEFADYGYENSSTNRIVKKAGISKGSLFKYFPTKEDFYFFVLDTITAELISGLEEKINTLSPDLFQRIIEYSVLEFSWYILYPQKAKMIVRAFTKSDTDIYRKTVLKYGNREQDIFCWFLQDIDTTQFRWERQKTIDLIKWLLKGFNDDFLTRIQKQAYLDFEMLEKEYVKNLSEYIEILKAGIIK
ncbi:MAG: TetR/AcrR family transcriptional regulator [Acetatifactor sp.]|nr:TetR/AcrR family transcriptional regulator [Acetatifactor sp.]